MILISIGKLDELAIVTVMLLLLVFAGVNVAVLVLRRDPVEHRHFVAPSVFPVNRYVFGGAERFDPARLET